MPNTASSRTTRSRSSRSLPTSLLRYFQSPTQGDLIPALPHPVTCTQSRVTFFPQLLDLSPQVLAARDQLLHQSVGVVLWTTEVIPDLIDRVAFPCAGLAQLLPQLRLAGGDEAGDARYDLAREARQASFDRAYLAVVVALAPQRPLAQFTLDLVVGGHQSVLHAAIQVSRSPSHFTPLGSSGVPWCGHGICSPCSVPRRSGTTATQQR